MKKTVALFICLILIYFISGCSSTTVETNELIVFAASSLTETLNEIKVIYKNYNENTELVFNFDSSGALKKQIEEGAPCDVFISASQKPMNELNCVNEDCRFNLLKNEVVLVVSEGYTGIENFGDMINKLRENDLFIAIGNEDVPVGEYTKQIFDYYSLDTKSLDESGLITYCSSAKEVVSHVNEGLVDCAVVFQTDAQLYSLRILDRATEEMCPNVCYPTAIIDNCKNFSEASKFLDFLKTEEASEVFENAGFSVISK